MSNLRIKLSYSVIKVMRMLFLIRNRNNVFSCICLKKVDVRM